MARKQFTPGEKILIVESYLRGCHQRGAVKALCREFQVSRALIAKWLDQLHRRAGVVFMDDAAVSTNIELSREVERLRRQNRTLWQRLRALDPDEPLPGEDSQEF